MIIDGLKRIVQQNANLRNRFYLLNLFKEELQSYILDFIYTNNTCKNLIFTGGTCLRRIYGLNRLSVDLDFDYETNSFPKKEFAAQILAWFRKRHQLKGIQAVTKTNSVKVKLTEASKHFPEIGKETIFVSVDFSPVSSKCSRTENNLISTPEFSFIVRNFDLPTMFANKILAFLARSFFSGKEQTVPFKARDVYDLYWLCQRSKQNQYQLKPNLERIFEGLNISDKKEIIEVLARKISSLEDGQLKTQLLPFFPDPNFIDSFVSSYRSTLMDDLKFVLED